MGVVVVPLLRKASQEAGDPESREQAKKALAEIEKVAPGALSPVFPRLVAFRKPAGAVEALLDFVPFADEEVVLSEVQSALNALAYEGGKPSPALLKMRPPWLSATDVRRSRSACTAALAPASSLSETRE